MPTHRYYLLTYPRTASNLLTHILSLSDQPSIHPRSSDGYFFIHTVRPTMHQFRIAGGPLEEWTPDERTTLMNTYQSCYEELLAHANEAATLDKSIFIKEHVPWLIEPVAKTSFVFGDTSTTESPWTVETPQQTTTTTTSNLSGEKTAQTHSPRNETIFPDEFLETWLPTFLIRHPALVFPSAYRTCVELEGLEVARLEKKQLMLEMTMKWSRTLYDWYAERFRTSSPKPLQRSFGTSSGALLGSRAGDDDEFFWPIVLDADDVMTSPGLVRKYSEIVGLDPARLKFAWAPASREELEGMHVVERRMRSTISASEAVVSEKVAGELDVDEEAEKWKVEFGIEDAGRIESWVRAAMGDYEYLRERRLKLKRFDDGVIDGR